MRKLIEHVKNDQEEAEAWTSDMGILATILNLMTYSNAHYGHQGEEGRKWKGSKDIPEEEKKEEVEEEEDKGKELRGTVKMCKLTQSCKQGNDQIKIYVLPSGQVPAQESTAGKTTALRCCGGEQGLFLSHGANWLFLQSGNLGAGELWCITQTTITDFCTIQCIGAEKGLSLTHVEGHLRLTCSNHGDLNQMWYVEEKQDGYTICCYSGASWMYLSHAKGEVFLQWAFLGAGELWQIV